MGARTIFVRTQQEFKGNFQFLFIMHLFGMKNVHLNTQSLIKSTIKKIENEPQSKMSLKHAKTGLSNIEFQTTISGQGKAYRRFGGVYHLLELNERAMQMGTDPASGLGEEYLQENDHMLELILPTMPTPIVQQKPSQTMGSPRSI